MSGWPFCPCSLTTNYLLSSNILSVQYFDDFFDGRTHSVRFIHFSTLSVPLNSTSQMFVVCNACFVWIFFAVSLAGRVSPTLIT